MELQENSNKLVECAYKWQMNFNADECTVMHIGHSMQVNYYMFYQQLPTIDQMRNPGIFITKDHK